MRIFTLIVFAAALLQAIGMDLKYLHDTIADNPHDVENRAILAQYYFNKNAYPKALQYINDALKVKPNDTRLINLKEKITRQQMSNAIFTEIGVKNLQDKEKVTAYLKLLYQQKQYQKYLILYDLTEKTLPFSEDIHINALDAALSTKSYQKAKMILDTQLFPQTSQTTQLKKLLYDKLNDPNYMQKPQTKQHTVQTKQPVTKATAIPKPVHQQAVNDVPMQNLRADALILHGMGKTEQAIINVMRFVNQNPNDIEAVYLLAQLYHWNGQNDKTKIILETVLPKTGHQKIHRLYKKIVTQKPPPAQKMSRKPQNSAYQTYHEGISLMHKGEKEKARAVFLTLLQKIENEGKPLPEHLTDFLHRWEAAWESKNFTLYKKFYASTMTMQNAWMMRKKSAFADTAPINIMTKEHRILAENAHRYKVKLYLEYQAKDAEAKGYNTMTIQCNSYAVNCKIIEEKFQTGTYEQSLHTLYPLVQNALKALNRPKRNLDL